MQTEADLCNAFSAHAVAHGWEVYPEAGGWDLLLVASSTVRTPGVSVGDQIGVQAKLHPNVSVLWQAIRYSSFAAGPHYRAVLIPTYKKHQNFSFFGLSRELRCLVYQPAKRRDARNPWWSGLDAEVPLHYRLHFDRPVWVSQYRAEQGGAPSPVKVTAWKIRAILFCLEKEGRSFTYVEVKKAGLHLSTLLKMGIVKESGKHAGRAKLYELVKEKSPAVKHPWLTKQIQEHIAKHGGVDGVHKLQSR